MYRTFKYTYFLVLILPLAILLTTSCSEYEKLLKSGDASLKYDKAIEYYEDGQYTRAVTLIEQVLPVYRATTKAEKLNYYHAMCYYQLRDYILAGHYFQNFIRTYNSSEFKEEVEYLYAYCYYLLSPKYSLDQSFTVNAIDALNLYSRKYPESEKVAQSSSMVRELENKLVKKSFESAKLYFNLGEYKSAIVAVQTSLEDYPESNFREDLLFLSLKAQFLLAENSIMSKKQDRYQNTIDDYYTFIFEFPESAYIKEAEKMFEDARSNITTNPDENLEITKKDGL